VDQYVVLGAGLDTFGPYRQLCVFLRFAAVPFERERLRDALARAEV
jgi:hypothetical protein